MSTATLFVPIQPIVPRKLKKRAARMSPVELEAQVEEHASKEFKQLVRCTKPKSSQFRAGSSYRSMCKNRYRDVLANDDTRVILDDGSYLNANLIEFALPGEGEKASSGRKASTSRFIACQAPLPTTIRDFYLMMWQQRSCVVVMLTDLREGTRLKADRYWPTSEEPELHVGGGVSARFLSASSPVEGLKVTVLELTVDGSSRQLYHLHYTRWKDHSTPENARALPSLVSYSRLFCEKGSDEQGLAGPMVCHCSAGIGRTGTFLALSVTLRLLELGHRPDVFQICRQMREMRSGMVQTSSQYLCIYQCANDYLKNHIQLLRRASSDSLLVSPKSTRPRAKSFDHEH